MIKRKDIIDAVKKLENLPSLNSSVLKMQDKLNEPEADVDFKEMASIIERDIGLSAKILRIANSAAYTGRYGRIGNLEQAISRLGIKQVCKLFLTFNSMQLFPKSSSLIDLGEFWKHSISVALVLRAIVDTAKKTDYNDSNGYMAGLLHDIGILILD